MSLAQVAEYLPKTIAPALGMATPQPRLQGDVPVQLAMICPTLTATTLSRHELVAPGRELVQTPERPPACGRVALSCIASSRPRRLAPSGFHRSLTAFD